MSEVIRLESQHSIPCPREEVWPVLSKTDWINRAMGLPAVAYQITPRAEGGGAVIARARLLGAELRWQEIPFEWLEPEFYRVHRLFENGPFLEAWMGIELRATQDDGTRVVVSTEVVPRNVLGRWVARRLLGPKAARDMAGIAGHVYEYLRGRRKVELPKLPVSQLRQEAFESGIKKLQDAQQPAGLIGLLGDLLREAPDVRLTHIRPFALAREWRQDRWDVLRLCLHATRSGLLDLTWEVLCPNCRSSRQAPAGSLGQLQRASHCEVCQIKFDAEFDRSVELKFAVNPGVRHCPRDTFCLAGPGGKPHVVSQCLLEPGQRRAWKIPELTHTLRLRSPQVREAVKLGPDDAPMPVAQPVILCEPERFVVRYEFGQVKDNAVQVFNPNKFPILLILERIEWSEDILTAARVTNWQEFRDLFSGEVISPGEQLVVGSQVVLFTDLRGSTAMYQGLGDAPAYALVRNHFAVLIEAVRAHRGTVVKTIGDAVMAVFSRVDEALQAVRQMHERLSLANPDPSLASRLTLKSSLHVGPCLAVNANDKLDYFGTTVNLAARMVDRCHGGDLTVSDEFFQRPETVEFLKTVRQAPESSEVRFRGFDAPHTVWRIPMT
jgi:class 3 adenylate cyclase